MAISTTADLNSLYNEIYEDALTTLRQENLVVAGNLVTIMNASGYATRIVPIWSKASVNIKPEGVDYINPSSYSKTSKATFSPTVRFSQFLLTDEMIQTEATMNAGIVNQARTELGGALAEQVDIDACAVFGSFTETKGSAGNALTLAIMGAAMAVLNNAKVRGARSAVLHPYHWHDLWVLLGQPTANQAFLGDVANEAMKQYFVGRFMNADWFVSANIAVDGSDDAVSGLFTREAIGYDEREAFMIEPERDASRKATELNASIGYAIGVLRQEAGVGIIGDATEPS